MSGKTRPPAEADWLTPQDRRALSRFVEQSVDCGFRLAILEVRTFSEREKILFDITPLIGEGLVRVAVDQLKGDNLWRELLAVYHETQPRCLALSGIESHPDEKDWLRQLNVQRDLFVRDIKVPWLLFIHPTVRVRLMLTAPDFCDFVALWVRDDRAEPAVEVVRTAKPPLLIEYPDPDEYPDLFSSLLDEPLFGKAADAISDFQFDEATDFLNRLNLKTELSIEERIFLRLLGARVDFQQARLRTAENILRACLAELTALPEEAQRDIIAAAGMRELGFILNEQGKYDEAESLFRQSLAICAHRLGTDNSGYGLGLRALAESLLLKGKYAEAESLLLQSLTVIKHELRADSSEYSPFLNALARVLAAQGKLDEAEALLRRSLAIDAKAFGTNHPSYGIVLYTLADVLHSQGRYEEAAALLRQALIIGENTLGTGHPSYGASLHALAGVLQSQGKYSESESLLRQSLAISEKVLGADHLSYASSLHALASVLQSQGRYNEAESLLRRALTIKENVLGSDHFSLSPILGNLAIVLAQSGQLKDVVPLAMRAVAIVETVHGPAHLEVGKALVTLAKVQTELRLPAAKKTAEHALQVLTQSLGKEHPTTKDAAALLLKLS